MKRARRHDRVAATEVGGGGGGAAPLGHGPLALVGILVAPQGLGAVEFPVAVVAGEDTWLGFIG